MVSRGVFSHNNPFVFSDSNASLNSIAYELIRCEQKTRGFVQNESFLPNNKYDVQC